MNEKFRVQGYKPKEDEKFIFVQILLSFDDTYSEKEFLDYIESLNFKVSTYKDKNDDTFINLNFYCKDIKKLWGEMKLVLLNSSKIGEWIKKVSLIACEGENGWDDYLVLWCQSYEVEELGEL